MKAFLYITLLFFSTQLVAQTGFEDLDEEAARTEVYESQLNWFTDFEAAKQEAALTNKPLVLFFTGSDWCAPCKMLKEDFFHTKAFEDKAKDLVLVLVDMPRRLDIITPEQRAKNKELVSKYNLSGSYPNLVAVNAQNNVIGELSGYTLLRETDTHFAFVENLIKNK